MASVGPHPRPWLAAVICSAVILVGAGTAGPAHAAFPGRNGVIAMVGYWPGCGSYLPGLGTVRPDGTGATVLLCQSPSAPVGAQWLASGNRLLVEWYSPGPQLPPLALSDAAGHHVRKLGNRAAGCGVSVAPDGRHVAYVPERGCTDDPSRPQEEIWRARLDGSRAHRLYVHTGATDPLWSPDGRRIAAIAGRWPDYRIVILDARTGRRIRSLRPQAVSTALDWSPSGRSLLYSGTDGGIYRVRTRGHHPGRLLVARPPFPGYWIQTAAWSPDGRRIVVGQVQPEGTMEVFTAGRRGGHRRVIFHYDIGGSPFVDFEGEFVSSLSWQPRPRHH